MRSGNSFPLLFCPLGLTTQSLNGAHLFAWTQGRQMSEQDFNAISCLSVSWALRFWVYKVDMFVGRMSGPSTDLLLFSKEERFGGVGG